MNGIHDMGGMHGLGPIEYDPKEGAFHEPWEGRAWAILRAMGPFGRGGRRRNFRFELEMIPAAEYLRLSYYERLLKTMLDRLVANKVLTEREIETGRPDAGSPRAKPLFTADMIDAPFRRRGSLRRDDVQVRARFRRGQRVRARNLNPVGHTRLPRYLRGKRGTIVRDHGVFDLQDTDNDGYRLGDFPQHVYTVRFEAPELWGPQGGQRDAVYADLWEDYLDERRSGVDPERLAQLPRIPADADGPVFAEPWQAQAFAMAVELSAKGHFTWKEWAAALAEELEAAAQRGEPDDGSRYYQHWLAALERLVTAKGLTDPATLVERKEAWADAYRHTPHGRPVELKRA